MKSREQYNAAVKYIEKNAYRVRFNDFIFYALLLGISGYFIVLFSLKIISCIR